MARVTSPLFIVACVVLGCLASTEAGRRLADGDGGGPKCQIGMNYAGTHHSTNPVDVPGAVKIMRDMGAQSIKLFYPDDDVMKALEGSDIKVITAAHPKDIVNTFAANQSAAQEWVDKNIAPWIGKVQITHIVLASEEIEIGSDKGFMSNIVKGMWAVYNALSARNLKWIKVVSPIHLGLLDTPIPPSFARVNPDMKWIFNDLLNFITKTGSSLMITNYPYYPLVFDPWHIKKDYVMYNGFNGYYDKGRYYQNMWDAQIDAVITAAENLTYGNVNVEIGETGWPTGGDAQATTENAQNWIKAMIGKACSGQGTPKRPGMFMNVHLFSAFDEDQKYSDDSYPWEFHWGIRNMNGSPKYDLNLKGPYSAPPTQPPPKWCVVKDGFGKDAARAATEDHCAKGEVDCGPFNGCDPDAKSSAVLNAIFQKSDQADWACDFGGMAQVTDKEPYNGCTMPGTPPKS